MKYDLSFLELELRELLKKLKKHNTYAMQLEDEIRLYALENERLNNDIKVLLKENENKEKVIKAQDNIINKAIEYIKELTDDNESVELMDISFYVKNEILNILQESDKE